MRFDTPVHFQRIQPGAYEAYHDLGGNGMVTGMYKEVLELEIRK